MRNPIDLAERIGRELRETPKREEAEMKAEPSESLGNGHTIRFVKFGRGLVAYLDHNGQWTGYAATSTSRDTLIQWCKEHLAK